MNLRALSSILCLLAAAAGNSQDGRKAPDLKQLPPILRKVLASSPTSRYSGERVIQFKKGPEINRHTELVWKDGRRSRTEFPDESPYRGQIIVDDGEERRHYYPDRNEIRIEPSRGRDAGRHLLMSILRSARKNLATTLTEGGKVAGQSTQLVTVSDSNGNQMQQLWIEPRSGVVLKRVLYDPVGGEIGHFEFRSINLKPIFTRGQFSIDRKGATILTPAIEARRFAQQLSLTAVSLPESSGFRLQYARIIQPEGRNVLLQSFSGKEGRFSLFQTRGSVDPKRLQRHGRQRISTYSWSRGDQSFALVGELSRDRLQQIAKFLGDA